MWGLNKLFAASLLPFLMLLKFAPAQKQPETFINTNDTIETVYFKNETLKLRIPHTVLAHFTSYDDASILHFFVPEDTWRVVFKFKAIKKSKSFLNRKCPHHNVTIYLKPRSFPVVYPENIPTPKNFLNSSQRLESYTLELKPNKRLHKITVYEPLPGNWFGAAFLNPIDPLKEKIEQQGLAADCETSLSAEMATAPFQAIILNDRQLMKNKLTFNPDNFDFHSEFMQMDSANQKRKLVNFNGILYKLFPPEDAQKFQLNVAISGPCEKCPRLGVSLRDTRIPNFGKMADHHEEKMWKVISNEAVEMAKDFFIMKGSSYHLYIQFIYDSNEYKRNLTYEKTKYFVEFSVRVVYQRNIEFDYSSDISLNKSASKSSSESFYLQNVKFYTLLRQSYGEFFKFDFDLMPDENGIVPEAINLTAGHPIGFPVDIRDISDVGGTLSFAVSINSNSKDSGPAKVKASLRSRSLESGEEEEEISKFTSTFSKHNVAYQQLNTTIIVCIRYGELGIPIWPNKCKYGKNFLPASAIIDHSAELVHIPYPESGSWFFTMQLFCNEDEIAAQVELIENVKNFIYKHKEVVQKMKAPCECSELIVRHKTCFNDLRCIADMNTTESLKIKDCLFDPNCSKDFKEHAALFKTLKKTSNKGKCKTSIVFSIASRPCIIGSCGKFGRCFEYMSGGFVFSTCLCLMGYRGWDCSNGTVLSTKKELIMSSAFLSLSNIFFIPGIYVAIKRRYFNEGLIISFSMLFSAVYHVCDADDEDYKFCIFDLDVLQYCDFYCGLLSIWAVLVAMAHLNQKIVSTLQILGAILLAFGAQVNKQSLWIFLIPVITGLCIITFNFGFHYVKSKTCLPTKTYLTIYLPIGMFIVIIGLVCYAFLQTKQNYHIMHSLWHILIATSILFLLPSK